MGSRESREWINTLVSVAILIVMIVGIWVVNDVSVNLKEFRSDVITTNEIALVDENGTISGRMYYNGSVITLQIGGAKLYYNGTCFITKSTTSAMEIC